jgi:cytochrome oxidase Cu insertion factor (SCO1/SenC/PrrC family)
MLRFIGRHPLLAALLPLGAFALLVQAQALRLRAERRHAEAAAAAALDDFGPVGEFSFVGRDGKPVTRADLDGRVWACACFFTCCTESCPQLSGALARLQAELADVPAARLVSLTVDPEHDNPDVLDRYARAFGADPARWLFLTGPREDVVTFVQGRLLLGVEKNAAPAAGAGNRVLHSDKLTLIDQNGRVRGYFTGTDPQEVGRLRDAMKRLAAEGP